MELRHLRYFKVLAETLNFTRAAELLHIAQPPLSRQISQLEDELGTLLVARERPLRLTEAGRFFYEQTCTVLQQLQNISDNTRRIGQGQRQWLGIGFAPSTLYNVLPELIRELRQDSELELGLSEMTTLQQVDALKSGRIDIAFGAFVSRTRPLRNRSCVKTRWWPCCPRATRWRAAHSASPSWLARRSSFTRPTPGPVMPTTCWRCLPSMA